MIKAAFFIGVIIFVVIRTIKSYTKKQSLLSAFNKAKIKTHFANEMADSLEWQYKTQKNEVSVDSAAISNKLKSKQIGEYTVKDTLVVGNRVLILAERKYSDYDVKISGSFDTVNKVSYEVYKVVVSKEQQTISINGPAYSSLEQKLVHEQFAKSLFLELGFA